jgi:hypothetical protein
MKPETTRLDPHAPSRFTLERRADGQLWAIRNGEATAVWVCRCFPWSAQSLYLSLRDAEDEEVELVRDPADLDERSRRALVQTMLEAGFVLEIEGIDSIEDDFEIRCWNVRTRQGPRSFQTALDGWPRRTPGGGLLIEDVAGDLFSIPAPHRLDADSQRLLWAFTD